MKKDKLAGLDPAEMRAKLKEMEEQNFQLRFRMSMGQTEGLRKIREMRKELQAFEKRLAGKEESLDKRIEGAERRESDLARRDQSIRSREKGVEEKQTEYDRLANEAIRRGAVTLADLRDVTS